MSNAIEENEQEGEKTCANVIHDSIFVLLDETSIVDECALEHIRTLSADITSEQQYEEC